MTPIDLPTDAELAPEARALLARRVPIGLYRSVAWSPGLLPPFMEMVQAFFASTTLDDRLREMVILRVAMHHGSDYEIFHHRRMALDSGVEPALLEALLRPQPCAGGDARDDAAIAYVDGLLQRGVPDAAADRAVRAALGPRGTVELALLIGFYRMVATYLAAIRLPLDPLDATQMRARSTP